MYAKKIKRQATDWGDVLLSPSVDIKYVAKANRSYHSVRQHIWADSHCWTTQTASCNQSTSQTATEWAGVAAPLAPCLLRRREDQHWSPRTHGREGHGSVLF